MADSKFQEELGGFFYDMLKAAGMTMLPGNFPERIRETGAKMARVIEQAAERKSIEVIKRLQASVLMAFEGTEKELSALRKLVLAQQELIDGLMKRKKAHPEVVNMDELPDDHILKRALAAEKKGE